MPGGDLLRIEAEPPRVIQEVAIVERGLVLEQRVVNLPELAVHGDGLRHLGCMERVRVELGERVVPEHEAQLVAQRALDGLDDRVGLAAVGALIVAYSSSVSGASAGPGRDRER